MMHHKTAFGVNVYADGKHKGKNREKEALQPAK